MKELKTIRQILSDIEYEAQLSDDSPKKRLSNIVELLPILSSKISTMESDLNLVFNEISNMKDTIG